jgi:hypothetical protein
VSRSRFAALGALVALTTIALPARADEASGVAAGQAVEVRLGVSAVAATRMAPGRLRALLELELGDAAVLAPGTQGPLGDHVAYVWIDLTQTAIVIEVRVGGRPVTRRELGWSKSWDAAMRLVVLSAADLVRSQAKPPPAPKKPPPPKRTSPQEFEVAARDADALEVSALLGASLMPISSTWLAGPAFELALRRKRASLGVWARLGAGDGTFGLARSLEAGLGAGYRIWASPDVRFDLAARAGFVSLYLPDAIKSGTLGTHDLQLARAGGHLAMEIRIDGAPRAGPLQAARWFGIRISPSALLGDVDVLRGTQTGPVGGFGIGFELSITNETLSKTSP